MVGRLKFGRFHPHLTADTMHINFEAILDKLISCLLPALAVTNQWSACFLRMPHHTTPLIGLLSGLQRPITRISLREDSSFSALTQNCY
ncbi:hypothetical protein SCLCIDRAFT_338448 [Scleroderma citrinum Foug A]|uniref:Uncharacterized protein n=1 Tax=Scleroderma citrinum Foug A TaxID=1036808 RepID=A0A0C3DEL8_9AGAM|nr:hypothetical protein SCLCIDRAFT_338448 [Scleroderma citrinum Foug A]